MEIWQLIAATTIPTALTAGIFYFLLDRFFKEENNKRSFQLRKTLSKDTLPQRLNAYERVALFLERIKPAAMAQRLAPIGSKEEYELQLLKNIQTEFDHNLSQQIYINPDTWNIIYSAKNATMGFIREIAQSLPPNAPATALQEELIKKSASENPSARAILYLQKDIQGI